jgi:pimeloyl-ACP methyl ester carboxylesterase
VPLSSEDRILEVGGTRIAYREIGEGEPLVLVSGIGMQLVAWPEGFLDRLAARGLRVVVFDNRDTGRSRRYDELGIPPVRTMLARRLFGLSIQAGYTLYDMARDVAHLLDALEIERAHVAGVSLGGMVVQALAIEHRARLKSLTSIMSYSGGRLLAGKPSATMRLLRKPPRTREQAIAWQIEFFRAVGSTKFRRDEAGLAERAGLQWDRGSYPPGFARQFAAVLATGDMRPRLRDVRVPALVLHGSVDPIFIPDCGRDTARALPNASFQLIDGWGHDLPDELWDPLADRIAKHVRAHA